MRKHPNDDNRDILFEFKRVGIYTKVSAIDPKTNMETFYLGSYKSSKEVLMINARYNLFKKIFPK